MSEDRLTTSEVSERTGVNTKTLNEWERDGKVSPESEGQGNGRRLSWSKNDVEDVVALRDRKDKRASADAFVEMLGGQTLMSNVDKAKRMLKLSGKGTLAVVSATGVHFIRADESPAPTLRRCGGVAVVISQE